MNNAPAIRKLPSEFVAEYLQKSADAPAALAAFEQARVDVRLAAVVGGTPSGERTLAFDGVSDRDFADSLLKSAWRHIYAYLEIDAIATAKDKKRLDTFLASPPDFTVENIRENLGDYLIDKRGHVLRGLAECFVNLDPAYKSHSKVRVGVKGLPKRVILQHLLGYRGRDTLIDILSAISRVDGVDCPDRVEIFAMIRTLETDRVVKFRDMTLKAFANGNVHLHFGPDSLRTINRGLAEYYGEVLPDAPVGDDIKRATSTAVSTDLAFYPSPKAVVDFVFDHRLELRSGDLVLEPSCGDGAILDRLARVDGVHAVGVEVDYQRAQVCHLKGHTVMCMNFLEFEPHRPFDWVIMNPPFVGRHYLKHIQKAIECLKVGGTLVAILPASAWYDHGELPTSGGRDWDTWRDLPVGSFSSVGVNIPTGVWKYHK